MKASIFHKSGAVSNDGCRTFSYRGWTIVKEGYGVWALVNECGRRLSGTVCSVTAATDEIDRLIWEEWAEL